MSDDWQKGTQKVKAYNRKHFRPKPKRICDSIAVEQSQKVQPSSLKISLLIAAYINELASLLNILQDILKSYGAIPSGIWRGYTNSISYTFALFLLTIHFCCVLIGWTDDTSCFQKRPRSCFVFDSLWTFFLALSYQWQYIDQEFCCLLRNLPSEVNTGMLLNNICQF